MRTTRYTEKEFMEAVNSSKSYAGVARKLGLVPKGGNYATIKKGILRLGLDISHMTGRGWRKGSIYNARPLEEYLVKGRRYSGLKKRLLREGVLETCCSLCHITEWRGQPAPLELDHINGDSSDNRLLNLRILCPNCHAQTPTYRGLNIKRRKEKPPQKRISNLCQDCKKPISRKAIRCRACNHVSREGNQYKIEWPPLNVLISLVKETSYLEASRRLGVSDNAIRKHIKRASDRKGENEI